MISWPAGAVRQSGGKLSSKAMISWPARAARYNGGKLSRKATISWPALAVRHEGGQRKQKANDNLAALRSARSESGLCATRGANRAEKQMIGCPSWSAQRISWPVRAAPFLHSKNGITRQIIKPLLGLNGHAHLTLLMRW